MQTTTERPAESAGELYFKTDVTPEQVFQALGTLRKEARDEIDRLIRFLDDTDDHMEREPDGDELDASYPESGRHPPHPHEDDEHDLGSPEPCTKGDYLGRSPWVSKSFDQTHPQNGEEGDGDVDGEHSLGFLERTYQDDGGLCSGRGGDLEDEHDGSEPEEDAEHSLGWPANFSQTKLDHGDGHDYEDQCEDEGADADREPSLGWTIDGAPDNTGPGREDLEQNVVLAQ